MVAETSRWGKKPFPRIRIAVTDGQRRAHLVLAPAAQRAALSGLFCGALLLSYLGVSQIRDPRLVARADSTAVRTEIANVDLQDAVARLEDRLARMAGERIAAENRLAAIKGQTAAASGQLAAAETKLKAARAPKTPQPAPATPPASSPDRVAQLKNALARVRLAVHALTAESATLAARLNKTEADRAEQSALYQAHKTSLAHLRRAARWRGQCCTNRTHGSGSASPELRVWEGRASSVRF